ncbi:MAG: transposase [Chitinophagaceae bacterium]|nr:transposase [Chitinophagaceae bacterium]
MKEKQILAIDVSKRSLDICVRPAGTTFKISNDLSGFKVLTAAISPDLDPLVVMEHTGLYSFQLEKYLEGQGYLIVRSLHLKSSAPMGWFGARTTRSIPYGSPSMPGLGGHNSYRPQNHRKVTRLNQLLSLRAKLVKDCGGYKARIKEMLDTELISKSDLIYKLQRTVMTTLNSQIQKVEKEIEVLIETDPELKKNFDLIRTIKGVGKIVAARMLAVTSNFKSSAMPESLTAMPVWPLLNMKAEPASGDDQG